MVWGQMVKKVDGPRGRLSIGQLAQEADGEVVDAPGRQMVKETDGSGRS